MYPGDLLGYAAKVADMERINQLIEIATDHPAGYFNYFTERPQVFDAAYDKAREILLAHR